jgi:uncharacterized protein (DUF1800 family)
MRSLLIGLIFLFLTPGQAMAMEFEEARHLLSRTGFGASYGEIREIQALDYEAAVDRLLAGTSVTPVTPAPAWISNPITGRPGKEGSLSRNEKKARQKMQRERALELKGWWYSEMIDTPSQLLEKMTLFWHNHFTSSVKKVKAPYLLYHQNMLLRQNATGNFADLLHDIAKDPAMVLYLDTQTNLKKSPNENFARELLELFTLGEGNYTEVDIKEGARAFSGWSVDKKTGKFRIRARQHDEGEKSFMGHKGNFDGDELIDVLLKDQRTAESITRKLWIEFVSDTPDTVQVEMLARQFRDSSYELGPLLKALLMSPAFRDPGNRGTLIKSPVELTVGTIRTLEIPVMETRPLVHYGRVLGQDIFDPPNVKGWAGGTSWIDTNTLLLRQTVLSDILHGTVLQEKAASKEELMKKMRRSMMSEAPGTEMDGGMASVSMTTFGPDAGESIFIKTLLPTNPVEPVEKEEGRDMIRKIIMDPGYNLK